MYTKLLADIKSAMVKKEVERKNVLKQVQAKAQEVAKLAKETEVKDEFVISALTKELKQLHQTKDSLANAKDSVLYTTTVYQIEVLMGYMPKMLSQDEISAEIIRIASLLPTGANFNQVMKEVSMQLKGKADGKLVKVSVDSYMLNRNINL